MTSLLLTLTSYCSYPFLLLSVTKYRKQGGIESLKENGFEVHVAVGGKAQEIIFADRVFDIPFQKNQ